MQEKLQRQDISQLMEKIVNGNLASLNPTERLTYYNSVCESLGLNPLTRPLEYITLKGKLTLYAKKEATEQLSKIYGISVLIKSRDFMKDDTFVVVAAASEKDGRTNEALGAVTVRNLSGEDLANALMKAESKAKRRAILSLEGMSFLDETEVEDAPPADKAVITPQKQSEPQKQKAEPAITVAEKPKEPEKQEQPEQPAEPLKVEFCIKQKAERENKGRKFFYLAILEEGSGEVKNVYVLAPADVEAINKGLENGILRYSGILKTVKDKQCLEQLQPLEETVEQKAS